ncbi:MAG: glycerophosphodiester phosphodiesterase [Aeromicrobium sp.]|nr:glycerophosphodiester phosphodiesterase [Aeromicrobium sp.]
MTDYLDPPPLAFAHRGGAKTAGNVGIENSMAAFAHAYELGYRYLETDVRCTSDGQVYAVHDESLERLTGSVDRVEALSSEAFELQLLDQREPFARLSALYEAFPDARLSIDVKSDDAVEPTCALVAASGAVGRTCLSSFSHARLTRMRRLLPDVTTSASTREVAVTRLLPAPLLRLAGRPRGQCLQVPRRHGPITVVTPRFVRRAHALGLQVHVWTVDEREEINELLDLGVDGIITDRTDVLKDVLVARGVWR